MVKSVCAIVILSVALFGTCALARPGYADAYDVDYHVGPIACIWLPVNFESELF